MFFGAAGDIISLADRWMIKDGMSAEKYYEENYYKKVYKFISSAWLDEWYILDGAGLPFFPAC